MTKLPMSLGLDPLDRAILEFVLPWLPFGELPLEEIFVEFGLTADGLVLRLREVIDRCEWQIHPRTVEGLKRLCDRIVVPAIRWTPGVSGA